MSNMNPSRTALAYAPPTRGWTIDTVSGTCRPLFETPQPLEIQEQGGEKKCPEEGRPRLEAPFSLALQEHWPRRLTASVARSQGRYTHSLLMPTAYFRSMDPSWQRAPQKRRVWSLEALLCHTQHEQGRSMTEGSWDVEVAHVSCIKFAGRRDVEAEGI